MGLLSKLFGRTPPAPEPIPENIQKLARHIEGHPFGIKNITEEVYHSGCGGELPTPGFVDVEIYLSETTSLTVRLLSRNRTRVFGTVKSADGHISTGIPHEAFSDDFIAKATGLARNRKEIRAATLVDELAL